jgi:hypothetical protein
MPLMSICRKFVCILCLFTFFTFSSGVQAQDYDKAAGVRFGYQPGLTGKLFTGQKVALEGILDWRYGLRRGGSYRGYRGFGIVGLIEYHIPIDDLPDFSLYIGGGGHFSFGNLYDCRFNGCGYYYGYTAAGVDLIAGGEYYLGGEFDLPFTVGLDVRPYFEIPFVPVDNFFPFFINPTFAVRYTFE